MLLSRKAMNRTQLILKWILILTGLFLMSAFATTWLPVAWMDSTHRWLGLGEFPKAPITIYLARSTSLLYGVHGLLMLYTGLTIQQHWRFVEVFGWLHIVMGSCMLAIDWTSKMPGYWTALEGPPVAILGVIILILYSNAWKVPASETTVNK